MMFRIDWLFLAFMFGVMAGVTIMGIAHDWQASRER